MMPCPNPSIARATITKLHRSPQSSIVLRCAFSGYSVKGRQLFKRIDSKPNLDRFTLSSVLSASANRNALDEGRQIHAIIIKKNLPMDVAVNNSLINLYFKCGSVGDAEKVFDIIPERDMYTWTVMITGYGLNGCIGKALNLFIRMPNRSTVSWNTMISACQQEGYGEIALDLFCQMRLKEEVPNSLTYVAVLKTCASLQLLDTGKAVHCCLVKVAWTSSIPVGCTLMDMYVKCGDLSEFQRVFGDISEHNVVSWSIFLGGYIRNGKITEAEKIFDGMLERNVFSWNVMISGYMQNGVQNKAFSLFTEMIGNGTKPNCFTLTSLISGCSNAQSIGSGKKCHGYAIKEGLDSDASIGNSLITMYGEQGNIDDARLVFDMLSHTDVVSWTAILAAYVSANNLDEANKIFDKMPRKNLISWNTIMFGYLQNSRIMQPNFNHQLVGISALKILYAMERSDVKPDHFSYNCGLCACADMGVLEQTRTIHARSIKNGFESDLGVGNALITAYGKCGALSEAEAAFKTMTNPDTISWNALLTAYSQNGQAGEVLNFYEKMQKSGIAPNHITFISLLSACSYMGEIKKGKEYFYGMEKDYRIIPTKEHYACIVDLLGRAGFLKEAESIIRKMPIKPDKVVWQALLGASKIHGDPTAGKIAADHIFHLEPDNPASYVALAETFAAASMWEDVAKLRVLMHGKRLLKEPGYSSIEIRKHVHTFLSGDSCSQPKFFIYEMLHRLYDNMTEDGLLF